MALGADLHRAVIAALECKVDRLRGRLERLKDVCHRGSEMERWILRRAMDDLVAAIEQLLDLSPAPQTSDEVVTLLIEAARAVPADAPTLRARHAVEAKLRSRPGLTDAVLGLWPKHQAPA